MYVWLRCVWFKKDVDMQGRKGREGGGEEERRGRGAHSPPCQIISAKNYMK